MMKKNGFTLAEVLITIAIIGIVATLTLPALMTNTQEQQAITGLKKGINTLTEAAQMNNAISGFDYGSFNSTSTNGTETQSLFGLLASRANVDYELTGSGTAAANAVKGSGSNFVVFFRDGSALSYFPTNTLPSSPSGGVTVGANQQDGLVYGITAIYDTNGRKGPNMLSNCNGQSLLAGSASNFNDSSFDCSTKANRVIKDQFGVRLRGAFAVPNGAAARWAYAN